MKESVPEHNKKSDFEKQVSNQDKYKWPTFETRALEKKTQKNDNTISQNDATHFMDQSFTDIHIKH